jgi:hypothetical protein
MDQEQQREIAIAVVKQLAPQALDGAEDEGELAIAVLKELGFEVTDFCEPEEVGTPHVSDQ